MAVLGDAQRAQVWAQIMQAISSNREGLPILKADLRAAVDACDQWVSDNSASYNSALPAAFRTNATPDQKTRLLEGVIKFRRSLGV